MKIREILSEGPSRAPLRKSAQRAIPNLASYDHLDNNNHPYLAYRFGIALAGSPDEDMPQEGPLGSTFNMVDYTEADNEIRKGAEKVMGISHRELTTGKSEELKTTNTTSPTAKPKKNRYGV